jgi:hypothetical protein
MLPIVYENGDRSDEQARFAPDFRNACSPAGAAVAVSERRI